MLQISAAVSEVLQGKLKIDPSRFYLKVRTNAGTCTGWVFDSTALISGPPLHRRVPGAPVGCQIRPLFMQAVVKRLAVTAQRSDCSMSMAVSIAWEVCGMTRRRALHLCWSWLADVTHLPCWLVNALFA
jgi:hypothetical protein